jgi:hypothetical protein
MRKLIAFFSMMMIGSVAYSQDFGVIAGFHQTNASGTSVNGVDASITGKFNFRIGGAVSVPLADQVAFRSGLVYTQRHFDSDFSAAGVPLATGSLKFDYIDVPALVQFNFNENVGIFGGLVAAFNVGKDCSLSNGQSCSANNIDTGVNSLIPLLMVGVNGTFQNQFGIEAYYERGMGKIYDRAKDYSDFGANFLYWF